LHFYNFIIFSVYLGPKDIAIKRFFNLYNVIIQVAMEREVESDSLPSITSEKLTNQTSLRLILWN
jgi:hypothetical protein